MMSLTHAKGIRGGQAGDKKCGLYGTHTTSVDKRCSVRGGERRGSTVTHGSVSPPAQHPEAHPQVCRGSDRRDDVFLGTDSDKKRVCIH